MGGGGGGICLQCHGDGQQGFFFFNSDFPLARLTVTSRFPGKVWRGKACSVLAYYQGQAPAAVGVGTNP